MMKINVTNLERFFEIVNACESSVQLIVAEREPEELRNNGFVQNLLKDTQNGVTKLSIQTSSEKDTVKLIRFMMEDGVSLNECKGSARVTAA
ncbi:MAG: hypothetical protein VB034_02200 [Eubacteriales bacterium]|nr:hypothetical protein [Eubacteriales bacterium]